MFFIVPLNHSFVKLNHYPSYCVENIRQVIIDIIVHLFISDKLYKQECSLQRDDGETADD